MRFPYFALILGLCFAFSCSSDKVNEEKKLSKLELILDSIANHYGSAIVFNSKISFGIKDRFYTVTHSANEFEYTCFYTSDSGRYVKQLNKSGFTEMVNNFPVTLSANDSLAKADSLNMTVTMALLPSLLLNSETEVALKQEIEIEGKEYYSIEIAIAQMDSNIPLQFVMWFETKTFALDYIWVKPFGKWKSSQFATSKNVRRVNGVVFQDYEVFAVSELHNFENLPHMFLNGQLFYDYDLEFNRLSVIENPILVSEFWQAKELFEYYLLFWHGIRDNSVIFAPENKKLAA